MHGNSTETRAIPSPVLAALCQKFWWPPYALLRDRGSTPAEASILTRHFLDGFSRGNEFGRPKVPFVRLRTGMFEALNGFLASDTARAPAYESTPDPVQPGQVPADAESWMSLFSAGSSAPGDAFRRRWALVLLDATLAALRQQSAGTGRLDEFEALKPGLARRLAASEASPAAEAQLAGFRECYQKLALEEVSRTVSTPAELEAEFGELFD